MAFDIFSYLQENLSLRRGDNRLFFAPCEQAGMFLDVCNVYGQTRKADQKYRGPLPSFIPPVWYL
jgi:hypothetical protein